MRDAKSVVSYTLLCDVMYSTMPCKHGFVFGDEHGNDFCIH